MKALVFKGPKDLRIEDVPIPKIDENAILIRVKVCGICGSDLHGYKLGWAIPDSIMGHEFSGDVVEVGTNVKRIKKGDRVTAVSIQNCGECYWCQKKQPLHCANQKILGSQLPGAFAEYVSIPRAVLNETVFHLPDKMSYEEGALIEPISVGVHVAKASEPLAGDTVVVIGTGMLGQCAMQAYKAMGVSRVIVSEVGKKRIDVAKATGADVVINARSENPVERVRELTSGRGAEIVTNCAGIGLTYDQAFEMVAPGGKIIIAAVFTEPLQLQPVPLLMRELKIIGVFAGTFPEAIDFMQTKKINMKQLITHEFSLDEAREAFETQLKVDESIKVLIRTR